MCSFLKMKIWENWKVVYIWLQVDLEQRFNNMSGNFVKHWDYQLSCSGKPNTKWHSLHCQIDIVKMMMINAFYQKCDIAILVYVNVWKRWGWKFFLDLRTENTLIHINCRKYCKRHNFFIFQNTSMCTNLYYNVWVVYKCVY